ncbi:MAG: GNAT family N-acetyltransferase [Mesorhizobium sp.]
MIAASRTPEIRHGALSLSDLDAVVALHRRSIEAVGRNDLIKPETPEFFARILGGGGRITGVWLDDAFVGYGVLQFTLPRSEDARPQLGLSSEVSLAKLAGACVLPDAWGGGLHDALIRSRIDQARQAGFEHLYATAAPGNARSWQNLFEAGFMVRGLVAKYGGHMRYLLHRDDGQGAAPPAAGDDVWCAAEDTEGQLALLAEGRWGMAWRRRDDGGRDLCYRKRT